MLRDPACRFALALIGLALALALHQGVRWYEHLRGLGVSAARVEADVAARSRALAAALDQAPNPLITPTRDPRNPYGFAHFQMQHTIVLPPTSLAALTTGQSDLLAQTLALTPGTPPSRIGLAEPDNPRRLLVGAFDPTFVVVALIPLFVIALTYGLVSSDRERGVLALVLAQPVTPRRLLVSRLLPRILLVITVLLAVPVGSVAHFGVANVEVVSLLLWMGVALAYAAFWFALSVAIAVRRGSSAGHALVLASLWLVLTVVIPAGVSLLAKTAFPVPSRMELILAMRAASDEISAKASQLLADYYEDHPEFAPQPGAPTEFAAVRLITDQRLDEALAPVMSHYQQRLEAQQRFVGSLQVLSPALLAQHGLSEAAGTGRTRHDEFLRQASAHHLALRAFFNPRILRKERFDAWDRVPRFEFVEPARAQVARGVLVPIAGLVLLTVACALWAGRSLRALTPTV